MIGDTQKLEMACRSGAENLAHLPLQTKYHFENYCDNIFSSKWKLNECCWWNPPSTTQMFLSEVAAIVLLHLTSFNPLFVINCSRLSCFYRISQAVLFAEGSGANLLSRVAVGLIGRVITSRFCLFSIWLAYSKMGTQPRNDVPENLKVVTYIPVLFDVSHCICV